MGDPPEETPMTALHALLSLAAKPHPRPGLHRPGEREAIDDARAARDRILPFLLAVAETAIDACEEGTTRYLLRDVLALDTAIREQLGKAVLHVPG